MPVATVNFPALGNNDIVASAGLAANKLVHQKTAAVELAEAATAVVAIDKLLLIASASGTLQAFEAAIVVQATGADRTVTVDLHRSTAGGAFATVLSTTVDITNSTTILVPVAGVISTTTVADGDIYKIVCTVAGSAGAQAKGLIAHLVYDENPIG